MLGYIDLLVDQRRERERERVRADRYNGPERDKADVMITTGVNDEETERSPCHVYELTSGESDHERGTSRNKDKNLWRLIILQS